MNGFRNGRGDDIRALKVVLVFAAILAGFAVAPAQAGRPTLERYRLQVEDIVRVQVFNQAQITGEIPVGRDGYITPPFLPSVKAAGRTIDDLIAELTSLYKTRLFLRDPIVSVILVQPRPQRAYISGIVTRPGGYPIRPGDTILGLYSQGGGAVQDNSDLRRAFLRRSESRELIPIDMYSLTVLGDLSQNYEVHDGDELTIPEQRVNRIIVLGSVQTPGAYPYREPMSVADAIALARGEVRYRSRFSKIKVIRQKPGQTGQYDLIAVDLVRYFNAKDLSQNIQLQPGDTVYVPETNTPDIQQIGGLLNTAFILNQFSSIFGLRILGG